MDLEIILDRLNDLYDEGKSIRYAHEDSRIPGFLPSPYSNKVNQTVFSFNF